MGCGKSKAQAPVPVEAVQAGAVLLTQPVEEKPREVPKEQTEPREVVVEASQPREAMVEAPQSTTVNIEIIGARGLCNRSEPYCVVEIVGKPESRIQTSKSENAKEPEWNHAAEVAGLAAGDSLVFIVKDSGLMTDDILGKATVTEEQLQMGYIGELQLTEAGEGMEAYLKVKLGEPGMLEMAKGAVLETIDDVQEAVDKAKEAIDDKIEEVREVIEDKVEETRANLNDVREGIVDQVEVVVDVTGIQIDDETKATFCKC